MDPSRKKFWTLHLDQQTQSGQSVAIYCRVHQLNRDTFFKWRKRLAAGGNSSLVSLDRTNFEEITITVAPDASLNLSILDHKTLCGIILLLASR